VGRNREVCEFGSDHGLTKIRGRILSDNSNATHCFDIRGGSQAKNLS
jgi:hypothetical protein